MGDTSLAYIDLLDKILDSINTISDINKYTKKVLHDLAMSDERLNSNFLSIQERQKQYSNRYKPLILNPLILDMQNIVDGFYLILIPI